MAGQRQGNSLRNACYMVIERYVVVTFGDLIFKRGQFSWESRYWDDDGRINSRDADGDWNSD